MALTISGQISIKDILIEMGQSNRTNASLNTLGQEWYSRTRKTQFNTTEHKLSNWRGGIWGTNFIEPIDTGNFEKLNDNKDSPNPNIFK